VNGTACLDSGATLFLFKSDFNPTLISPGKATTNIHGYGANMAQTVLLLIGGCPRPRRYEI
jgi:hypothetical protein